MADEPIELDARRGMAARKATEERRDGAGVRADQAMLRHRQDGMEASLLAGPATSWRDVGAKAAYLISIFAETPEGREPRHRRLIESALEDIRRLSNPPPSDGAGPNGP